MEGALKKICNASKARGSLLTRDWDSLPLPSLPREGKSSIFIIFLKLGPQYTTINSKLEQLDVIT